MVIDPGVDTEAGVLSVLAEARLSLAAVLLTHGHIDHAGNAARLANSAAVPVYLHQADEPMLRSPMQALGGGSEAMLLQLLGTTELEYPDELRDLSKLRTLQFAGLDFRLSHAPGHTPGCMLIQLDADEQQVLFTGDVIFDRSIGRTDFPGGDSAAMLDTLRTVVSPMPDEMYLLPGHGPGTTMGQQRDVNPYLQASFLENYT